MPIPYYIAVWKDFQANKIFYTPLFHNNKLIIEYLYNTHTHFPLMPHRMKKNYVPKVVTIERKLLYLFRIKAIKYGSMSLPKLHK
jgi:hypothetical protein